MKNRGLIFILLCTLLAVALLLPASAEGQDPSQRIYDRADFLSDAEEARLEALAAEKATYGGCPIYVATHSMYVEGYYQGRYLGEKFLRDHGLSSKSDLILLVVTLDRGTYYYDLYLYGDAWDRINSKEVDYILDADGVYDNLKGGRLEAGLTAFLGLSAQGYRGRVGVSYGVIIAVTLTISLLIGFFSCLGVYYSYKAKKKSVDYPLDQFAKLELTEESDVFVGSFVTQRVIQSSSGGGRGGGSSHGGGGGHAGGR